MTPRRWFAVIGGVVALDVIVDRRQGMTLSQALREVYRTDTPGGRAALVASWAVLTAWLIPHLWKRGTP